MDFLSSFFLGLIQGITEWLPISSSAHLILAQNFFNFNATAEFDIFIMLGTTLALILYFYKKIFSILSGLIKFQKDSIYTIFLLILAGFFTALIGFPLRVIAKSYFYYPLLVCFFLFFNGILIYFSSKKEKGKKSIDPYMAIAIGIAQAFAVFPGISRSGSTISIALLLGANKMHAAEFSFLLGIPSMLFASVFEFFNSPLSTFSNLDILLGGFAGAFLTGYLSIHLFFEILKKGKWVYFAYYCIFISLIFLLYFLFF